MLSTMHQHIIYLLKPKKLPPNLVAFIISQFLWIRNPNVGPLAKGLSQGSNQGVSWGSCHLGAHLGKDPFPGFLVWLLASFNSFQWLTSHVINPC